MNSPLYRLFIRLLILCVIAVIAIAADGLAVAYGVLWLSLFQIFLWVVIIVMVMFQGFEGTLKSGPDEAPLSLSDILTLNMPCRWSLILYFTAFMATMATAIFGWLPVNDYFHRPIAWVIAFTPLAVIILWAQYIRESSRYVDA